MTSNGLGLCELCRRKVDTDLDYVPVYFRNLARWQPGATSSRGVPTSRAPSSARMDGGDLVTRAMDEAVNTLGTWARALADDRGRRVSRLLDRLTVARLDDAQTIAWLCLGFQRYLTSLSTLGWCGVFVTEVGQHEEKLRTLTERVAPGWYAGSCRCGRATYVIPGLTWVTCKHCGLTTYAIDHLDTILEEARGWVAPPMRLAEIVVALVDDEISVPRLHKRIVKWGDRGRISIVDNGRVGPRVYRLGDVLDAVKADGTTKLAAVS